MQAEANKISQAAAHAQRRSATMAQTEGYRRSKSKPSTRIVQVARPH